MLATSSYEAPVLKYLRIEVSDVTIVGDDDVSQIGFPSSHKIVGAFN
jgi:hypothetical protein